MTDSRALINLSISEAASALRQGETTSVALTQATLARIKQTEPTVQAYATVPADLALAAAQRADREIAAGRDRGPLHGIPIGVKDNCYTEGILTEVGSKVLEGFVPDFDSTVVQKLYAAGAVLIGKTAATNSLAAAANHRRAAPGISTDSLAAAASAPGWRWRRTRPSGPSAAIPADQSASRRLSTILSA